MPTDQSLEVRLGPVQVPFLAACLPLLQNTKREANKKSTEMALSTYRCSSLLCSSNSLSGHPENPPLAAEHMTMKCQRLKVPNALNTKKSPTPNQPTGTQEEPPLQENKTLWRTSNLSYPFYYSCEQCSMASRVNVSRSSLSTSVMTGAWLIKC